MLTPSSLRSEDPSITPQDKNDTPAADKTLAAQRLEAFIVDALRLAEAYGTTTTAQARCRMMEKVKGFEEDFNKGQHNAVKDKS
jgi:hypothetical protein